MAQPDSRRSKAQANEQDAAQISEYPPKLTVAEKVSLYSKLTGIATSTLITTAISAPWRGDEGAKSLRMHLMHAIVRKLNDRLSTREYQYLLPPTCEAYTMFAKQKEFTEDTVELKRSGALGHWIGSRRARNVLVYYHGGGFALSAIDVYFEYLWELVNNVNEADNKATTSPPSPLRQRHDNNSDELAAFVVSYTLTPHARYPTQLIQCADALRYIIREAGFAPRNVFLGGDSAGANVTMAVLAHVSHHPNPDVLSALPPKNGRCPAQNSSPGEDPSNPERQAQQTDHSQEDTEAEVARNDTDDSDDDIWREEYEQIDLTESDEYLGGIFLIGPWVDFNFERQSEVKNRRKDCLSKLSEARWAQDYVNGRPFDNWSEPGLAPSEWWKGSRVEEVLVLAGSDEILLDGTKDFVEKLQSMVPSVIFSIGQDEGHVALIVDRPLFRPKERKKKLQSAEVLENWMLNRVKSRKATLTSSLKSSLPS